MYGNACLDASYHSSQGVIIERGNKAMPQFGYATHVWMVDSLEEKAVDDMRTKFAHNTVQGDCARIFPRNMCTNCIGLIMKFNHVI